MVDLSRETTLLDLRGPASMRAGATAELAKSPDVDLTQAWSRYLYENDGIYGQLDGLLYGSAHNDEDCILLYERAINAIRCPSDCSIALNDPTISDELLEIADYYGLEVESSGPWP